MKILMPLIAPKNATPTSNAKFNIIVYKHHPTTEYENGLDFSFGGINIHDKPTILSRYWLKKPLGDNHYLVMQNHIDDKGSLEAIHHKVLSSASCYAAVKISNVSREKGFELSEKLTKLPLSDNNPNVASELFKTILGVNILEPPISSESTQRDIDHCRIAKKFNPPYNMRFDVTRQSLVTQQNGYQVQYFSPKVPKITTEIILETKNLDRCREIKISEDFTKINFMIKENKDDFWQTNAKELRNKVNKLRTIENCKFNNRSNAVEGSIPKGQLPQLLLELRSKNWITKQQYKASLSYYNAKALKDAKKMQVSSTRQALFKPAQITAAPKSDSSRTEQKIEPQDSLQRRIC